MQGRLRGTPRRQLPRDFYDFITDAISCIVDLLAPTNYWNSSKRVLVIQELLRRLGVDDVSSLATKYERDQVVDQVRYRFTPDKNLHGFFFNTAFGRLTLTFRKLWTVQLESVVSSDAKLDSQERRHDSVQHDRPASNQNLVEQHGLLFLDFLQISKKHQIQLQPQISSDDYVVRIWFGHGDEIILAKDLSRTTQMDWTKGLPSGYELFNYRLNKSVSLKKIVVIPMLDCSHLILSNEREDYIVRVDVVWEIPSEGILQLLPVAASERALVLLKPESSLSIGLPRLPEVRPVNNSTSSCEPPPAEIAQLNKFPLNETLPERLTMSSSEELSKSNYSGPELKIEPPKQPAVMPRQKSEELFQATSSIEDKMEPLGELTIASKQLTIKGSQELSKRPSVKIERPNLSIPRARNSRTTSQETAVTATTQTKEGQGPLISPSKGAEITTRLQRSTEVKQSSLPVQTTLSSDQTFAKVLPKHEPIGKFSVSNESLGQIELDQVPSQPALYHLQKAGSLQSSEEVTLPKEVSNKALTTESTNTEQSICSQDTKDVPGINGLNEPKHTSLMKLPQPLTKGVTASVRNTAKLIGKKILQSVSKARTKKVGLPLSQTKYRRGTADVKRRPITRQGKRTRPRGEVKSRPKPGSVNTETSQAPVKASPQKKQVKHSKAAKLAAPSIEPEEKGEKQQYSRAAKKQVKPPPEAHDEPPPH